MKGFLSRFGSFWKNRYRAIIYILTFAFVWLALINKKPLDLSVSDATQGALDLVEKMPENHRKKIAEQEELLAKLQKEESQHSSAELTAQIDEAKAYLERLRINSNGVFLVCIDFDAGSDAELGPMAYSSIRHAFSLGIQVLIKNGYTVMAQPLSQMIVDSAALGGATMPRPYGFKEAGSDFVFFGFRPNPFQVYLQMGESVLSAYETDYSGKALADMPIMKGIKDIRDIDGIAAYSCNVGTPESWINVAQTKFNIPLVVGMTAVSVSDYFPYLQSGQLCGLITGLRGAAEYEKAVGAPPVANRRMWAQLYTHAFAIGLIIVGNIEYFIKGKRAA